MKDLWHHHPAVRSGRELTRGERAADISVRVMGSWGFIWAQAVLIALWMTLNVVAWCAHWDEKPFIMLNLIFSIQAAFAAPLVLLAQRRSDQTASEEAHSTLRNTEKLHELLSANAVLTREIHKHLKGE